MKEAKEQKDVVQILALFCKALCKTYTCVQLVFVIFCVFVIFVYFVPGNKTRIERLQLKVRYLCIELTRVESSSCFSYRSDRPQNYKRGHDLSNCIKQTSMWACQWSIFLDYQLMCEQCHLSAVGPEFYYKLG